MKLTTLEILQKVQNDHLYIQIRFGKHGRAHAERVLLFANMLAAMIQADKGVKLDMQALAVAALLHDCKKVEGHSDPNHSVRSAKAACDMLDRLNIECDKEKVFDVIVRHCLPEGYHLEGTPSFEAMAVGDADKLDRFRFHRLGGPDPKFFQLRDYSIAMMDIAARVNGHKWRSFKK